MKYLILALLYSNLCFGQNFRFNTNYYDAVDKWVAFNKKANDSTYVLGFIYLDEQSGFTFNLESYFIVAEKGLEKVENNLQFSVKTRLSPNTAKVHILTDEQVAQLGLPKQPDWLEIYKKNENKSSYLVNIGWHYNHVGASKNAIQPLLKAYQMDPNFESLAFELAYAYNATKDHQKAIDIASKALEHDKGNVLLYKELGYAFMSIDDLEKAEQIYRNGISISDEKNLNAEMAINMAQSYFKTKNKAKFEEWAEITKKNAEIGSRIYKHIEYLEKVWNPR